MQTQTMVDTLSTSEGSMEDALQKQLSDVNNRNGQLESALLQARGDFKKLTQEAAVVARKAETHLKTIYEMQGMQRRAEQAEDLHDLLLLTIHAILLHRLLLIILVTTNLNADGLGPEYKLLGIEVS